MYMTQSVNGLLRGLETMANEVERRAKAGGALDEDFLFEYQPKSYVFGVQDMMKNLAILAKAPERHAEFFEMYVDLPETTND